MSRIPGRPQAQRFAPITSSPEKVERHVKWQSKVDVRSIASESPSSPPSVGGRRPTTPSSSRPTQQTPPLHSGPTTSSSSSSSPVPGSGGGSGGGSWITRLRTNTATPATSPKTPQPAGVVQSFDAANRQRSATCPINASSNSPSTSGSSLIEGTQLQQGYLNKLSDGRFARWRTRWFAFLDDKLVYWKNKEAFIAKPNQPDGEVDIHLCSTKETRVGDKRWCFAIVTAKCNMYFEAASHEERLGWLCSIDEVKTRIAQKGKSDLEKKRVTSMITREKLGGYLSLLVEGDSDEDSWQRRYFVIQKNHFLCYYKDKQDRQLAGSPIDLLFCSIQEVPGDGFCFEIMEGRQVYWLLAESELEMCSWISSLRDAISSAQTTVYNQRNALVQSTTQVTKAGWLKKQTAKGWRWKKRWFVLQGEHLTYYNKPPDQTPKNTIGDDESSTQNNNSIKILFAKVKVIPKEVQIKGHPYAFELLTAMRTYRFEADTADEMKSWMCAIDTLTAKLLKTRLRDTLDDRRGLAIKIMSEQRVEKKERATDRRQ